MSGLMDVGVENAPIGTARLRIASEATSCSSTRSTTPIATPMTVRG
jgi:hypothetical protein